MIHKLFTLPVRALILIGEKVKEEVDHELYDISFLHQQLLQLYMDHEMHEIPEDIFVQKERELLRRLQLAKERQRQALEEE